MTLLACQAMSLAHVMTTGSSAKYAGRTKYHGPIHTAYHQSMLLGLPTDISCWSLVIVQQGALWRMASGFDMSHI